MREGARWKPGVRGSSGQRAQPVQRQEGASQGCRQSEDGGGQVGRGEALRL